MCLKTNCLFLLFSISYCCHVFADTRAQAYSYPEDSVQAILETLSQTKPKLVDFIPETQRWYLTRPRPDAVPEKILVQIQDAFYHDINTACRLYAWRYLLNWRALVAKAARESFWGTSFLCNRTFNYFGIRAKAKPWICSAFDFCASVERKDPKLAAFVVFPDFESSIWMFIHTIYSQHYLERLPDLGSRIMGAIEFERRFGFHYWEGYERGFTFPQELGSQYYSIEETLATWSGHEINNLCVDCSRESDLHWIEKVNRAAERVHP